MLRISGRSTLGPASAPSFGPLPNAPTQVTSIAKDSGATVSFLAPTQNGPFTTYTVTPYITGVAQSPTTIAVGSAESITGSDGNTYVQVPVSGLTNSTSYTFSVHANNANGSGTESGQSGANTPLSGLVFGDDFNGPSGGPIDPEWWIYTRCGYLGQSEVEYYLPSQVSIDGNSNLLLTATKTSYTGPSYPSAGGGNVTQPWRSGAVQSNTRTYTPSSGNTMTFETRQQVCPDAGSGGMWPGFFWLEGSAYLTAWKTDPDQTTWDNSSHAEIDVAEWNPDFATKTNYLSNVNAGGGWSSDQISTSTDFSAAMHVFSVQWKPGVSVTFFRDGTQTYQVSSANCPVSGAELFLLIYLQILSGSATATQSCMTDYIRVYDQNLG